MTHSALPPSVTSLRAEAARKIAELLVSARFDATDEIVSAALDIVDGIHVHVEERIRFFPEVVLTTDLERLLRPIGAKPTVVPLGRDGVTTTVSRMLKLCGPLARSGWTVFLECPGSNCRYGLVLLEGTELSPSLFDQLVGELAPDEYDVPVAYFRGLVGRNVEVTVPSHSHVFSLGLGEVDLLADPLFSFVSHILKKVPDGRRKIASSFLVRLLREAIREAHGCLLVVVDGSQIDGLKATLADGIYLEEPVDFLDLLRQSDEIQNRQASTAVREFATLVKGMISQDGITAFTTDGRLIAFRVFVPPNAATAAAIGGARRRAFSALHATGLTVCCLMASQDGGLYLAES